MPLTDDRIARWARQLLVPGLGEDAHGRLQAARVRAAGADAIASAALVALVQAGVGLLWIDDPEPVSPADLGGWLYGPASVGARRAAEAAAALRAFSAFVSVEPYPTGGIPTAALVATPVTAQALVAAEASRRAGVPHVILERDGEGGSIVSVPPGAPCYACARNVARAGRPPAPGAAAASVLAASELLHMIAMPGSVPGRRIDVVRGVATARATVRLAGCACASAQDGAVR